MRIRRRRIARRANTVDEDLTVAEISRESFITERGGEIPSTREGSIAVSKLPYAVSTGRFSLLPTELTKPRGLGSVLLVRDTDTVMLDKCDSEG